MNLGNALETRSGLQAEERHFDAIRDAGFGTVRLPVKWSLYAADDLVRVDDAVGMALDRDLDVVLNVHHYDELQAAPDQHEELFVALWRRIAARYADRPDRLYFELLNEPRDAMTAGRWNALIPRALAAVRESNPSRMVIVGSARMNDIDALPELALPADDRLIATVHYYAPFEFTHQGAHWVAGADEWLGTAWGTDADHDAVRADLERAATWAEHHRLPLFIGEFGAYEKADMASRARWTAAVRTTAERLGIGWAYWEFGTDFGAFDPDRLAWREPLLHALVPDI
jgi:endoglucanase